MTKKSSPFDTKLRREVALLMHLNELTSTEVIDHYNLDKSYYKKLALWKHRTGKKYKKLTPEQQDKERTAALQRFYGVAQASVRHEALKRPDEPPAASQEMPEEILADDLIAEFVGEEPKEEPIEVTPEVIAEPIAKPIAKPAITTANDCNNEISAILDKPMTPEGYEQHINGLKFNGITSVDFALQELQRTSAGLLVQEIETLNEISLQLNEYTIADLKPRDLKTLTEVMEKVMTLRRKALLLPFGHLDPNAKPQVNVSKQVHFHNHGLTGFNPHEK